MSRSSSSRSNKVVVVQAEKNGLGTSTFVIRPLVGASSLLMYRAHGKGTRDARTAAGAGGRKRKDRFWRATILMIVAGLGIGCLASSSPVPVTRHQLVQPAIWVWHWGAPRPLLAEARLYGVKRLFVSASPGFSRNPTELARLTTLRTLATQQGVHLDALSGDPSWAEQPEGAGAWAREVAATGLFERLHVDIEPQASMEWQSDQRRLTRGLLSAIDQIRPAGLPVEADIPYWYWRIPTDDGIPLDVAILRRITGITIMAYQDAATKMLAVSTEELAHAAQLGKYARIGVNVGPPGGDAPSSSFWGQPSATILNDVAMISRSSASWTSFAGIAWHDSESLARL